MKNFITIIAILVTTLGFGQEQEFSDLTFKLGGGINKFSGDFKEYTDKGSYSTLNNYFSIGIEKRLGEIFAAGLTVDHGTLSQSEYSSNTQRRNFESNYTQAGLDLTVYTNNDAFFGSDKKMSPFLSFGFQYLTYSTGTDLQDNEGNVYYYWSDGSIRSLEENSPQSDDAIIMQRDHVYETDASEVNSEFQSNGFNIPVILGFKLQFSDQIDAQFYSQYNITTTDWIDNVQEGGNDMFLQFGAKLSFKLNNKTGKDHDYEDIDFIAVETEDEDQDGVEDLMDDCPKTPTGTKVDSKGCPLDSDKDGVPDSIDEEPDTKTGSIVDERGVTLTDEMIAARRDELNKIRTERHEAFSENKDKATLHKISDEIEKEHENTNKEQLRTKIPTRLIEADLDHNGLISAGEISAAIDGFFDGSHNMTVGDLNDLIDYFFEQ